MYNYAYIKNNIVVNIAVFDSEKSQEFLSSWAESVNVDLVVPTVLNCYIGQEYIDGEFIFPILEEEQIEEEQTEQL
jgi:hypothetical protein